MNVFIKLLKKKQKKSSGLDNIAHSDTYITQVNHVNGVYSYNYRYMNLLTRYDC